MPSSHFNVAVRKSAKWLLLVLIAGVVFYRVKFAAVPVEAFEVKPATVPSEWQR